MVKSLCPPSYNVGYDKAMQRWRTSSIHCGRKHSRTFLMHGVEGAAKYVPRDSWRSFFESTKFKLETEVDSGEPDRIPLAIAGALALTRNGEHQASIRKVLADNW